MIDTGIITDIQNKPEVLEFILDTRIPANIIIDIQNKPKVLEFILDNRIPDWIYSANVINNPFWIVSRKQTPRYFKFNIEAMIFSWLCEDDIGSEHYPECTIVNTVELACDLLEFIYENQDVFVISSQWKPATPESKKNDPIFIVGDGNSHYNNFLEKMLDIEAYSKELMKLINAGK